MTTVFLNGDFKPLEQAQISVLDRGFTFGDAVYEVIPVYGQHIFRMAEHLQRLHNSLEALFIPDPHAPEEWEAILEEVLARNAPGGDRSLYVQVSRGVSERDHLQINDLTPTVFVMSRAMSSTDFSKGVKVITHEDIRWQYCHIKATTLLANVLLKHKARQSGGAFETILVRNGFLTEAAASNVFIVEKGKVMTPEKDGSVLPGITRDLVVELLAYAGLDHAEQPVPRELLQSADEIWISSSSIGIAPVIEMNGAEVGDGKPGATWKKVNDLFREFKNNPGILEKSDIA